MALLGSCVSLLSFSVVLKRYFHNLGNSVVSSSALKLLLILCPSPSNISVINVLHVFVLHCVVARHLILTVWYWRI